MAWLWPLLGLTLSGLVPWQHYVMHYLCAWGGAETWCCAAASTSEHTSSIGACVCAHVRYASCWASTGPVDTHGLHVRCKERSANTWLWYPHPLMLLLVVLLGWCRCLPLLA
jgi:hypothetical protein